MKKFLLIAVCVATPMFLINYASAMDENDEVMDQNDEVMDQSDGTNPCREILHLHPPEAVRGGTATGQEARESNSGG